MSTFEDDRLNLLNIFYHYEPHTTFILYVRNILRYNHLQHKMIEIVNKWRFFPVQYFFSVLTLINSSYSEVKLSCCLHHYHNHYYYDHYHD